MKQSIQSLVCHGLYDDAFSLYASQHAAFHQPTSFTFPFLFKACSNLQSPVRARQVHTHIVKTGFLGDTYTTTALTDAYMKVGLPDDAIKVFEEMPCRSLPSYNAVICGLAQNGCFQESILAFRHLGAEGFRPSSVTLAGMLPACRNVDEGSQLHGLGMKAGHELDAYLSTALVTMYCNCEQLASAQQVFGSIPLKKVVSYNAMMSGLSRNGSSCKALAVFREMMFCSQERPNESTFLSALSACSDVSYLQTGKLIHGYLLRRELVPSVMIGTALIDMYTKCGQWERAYSVFMRQDERNIITWNTMISCLFSHGYTEAALEWFQKLEMEECLEPDMATWNLMISGLSQQGNGIKALRIFRKMQLSGVGNPSVKINTSLLEACSSLSSLRHGKEIHSHAIRSGRDGDEVFATALAHFYMKCASTVHARSVFDGFEKKSRDPALWNAMICGYGRNNAYDSAVEIFLKMKEEDIRPNSATFLGLLSVSAHAGQVERGWEFFRMMSKDYSLEPKSEHFGCMVDLLGRAGQLNDAWYLLQEIHNPLPSAYFSLLGACKDYLNAELGALVAERLTELEPGNPTPYVILSSIYAELGRWDDAERSRRMIVHKGLIKDPACSRIDVRQPAVHLNKVNR